MMNENGSNPKVGRKGLLAAVAILAALAVGIRFGYSRGAEKAADHRAAASQNAESAPPAAPEVPAAADPAAPNAQTAPEAPEAPAAPETRRSVTPSLEASAQAALSEEDAKGIALDHAGLPPGARLDRYRGRLDLEDGILVYDIEFIFEGNDYDYEIDANTGEIVSWDKEREDWD